MDKERPRINHFAITVEPIFIKWHRKPLVNWNFYKKSRIHTLVSFCIKIGVQLWCQWDGNEKTISLLGGIIRILTAQDPRMDTTTTLSRATMHRPHSGLPHLWDHLCRLSLQKMLRLQDYPPTRRSRIPIVPPLCGWPHTTAIHFLLCKHPHWWFYCWEFLLRAAT